jgi:hypothetical protein
MSSGFLPRAIAIGATTLSLIFSASFLPAQASTFDFAAFANSHGEGVWNNQVWDDGNYSVKATATGNQYSKAYLDGSDGGKLAGLGVCSSHYGCAGNSDDNVGRAGDTSNGALETLVLKVVNDFNASLKVKLADLFFRDRDHNNFNGQLKINGFLVHVVNGDPNDADLAAIPANNTFTFERKSGGTSISRDFYLSSVVLPSFAPPPQVPIPGAMPLFMTGAGVLGGLLYRRKRKVNAAAA